MPFIELSQILVEVCPIVWWRGISDFWSSYR